MTGGVGRRLIYLDAGLIRSLILSVLGMSRLERELASSLRIAEQENISREDRLRRAALHRENCRNLLHLSTVPRREHG
jgi:hypothetical protein